MRKSIFVLFTLSVLLFVGCVKEEIEVQPSQDGSTQFILKIDNPAEVETYGIALTNECMFDTNDGNLYYDLYILVFGSNGKYKTGEAVAITNVTGTNGAATRKISTQIPILTADKVVVLANTGIPYTSTTAGLKKLVVGTSTVADINTAFPSTGWNINQLGIYSGKGLPMSGTISSFVVSTTPSTLNLYRSVAKVQVNIDPSVLASVEDRKQIWRMIYHSKAGAIYSETPQSTGAIVVPSGEITFHSSTSVPWKYEMTRTSVTDYLVTLYVPEYNASTRAKGVTVDGSSFAAERVGILLSLDDGSTYYRLDLVQKQSDGSYKYLDIKRNCHYIVNVTKVNSAGYATMEEAIKNPPSNIEYHINHFDPDLNVTDTNGQYAISLEYDTLIAYTNASQEHTLKATAILGTFVTNLPDTNTITASGGVRITGGITSLSTATDVVKFKIEGDSGTITFKLGNITHDVTLIRRPIVLDAHYNLRLIEGNFSGIVWLDDGITSTLNGTTSMTITTPENITPTNASELSNPYVEPTFESKFYEGHFSTSTSHTKLLMEQVGPEYIGWGGGTPGSADQLYYSKRLIAEVLEEGHWDYQGKVGDVMMFFYYYSTGSTATDKENGRANMLAFGSILDSQNYYPVYTCAQKGYPELYLPCFDKGWYVPTQNQLMLAYISDPSFNNSIYTTSNEAPYWSSSQSTSNTEIMIQNFYTGETTSQIRNLYARTRCVREL